MHRSHKGRFQDRSLCHWPCPFVSQPMNLDIICKHGKVPTVGQHLLPASNSCESVPDRNPCLMDLQERHCVCCSYLSPSIDGTGSNTQRQVQWHGPLKCRSWNWRWKGPIQDCLPRERPGQWPFYSTNDPSNSVCFLPNLLFWKVAHDWMKRTQRLGARHRFITFVQHQDPVLLCPYLVRHISAGERTAELRWGTGLLICHHLLLFSIRLPLWLPAFLPF